MKNLIYRCKYHFGRYLPLEKPVDIALELSSICNLKCPYCYHAKKPPFELGFMYKDVATKIIKQGARYGVNSIKFNWRGESTLHPNFSQLTGLAKRLSGGMAYIDRISNSNFAFKARREDILQGMLNQTKVKISFDSFMPDVFEKQRVGASHDVVLKNIDDFYHMPGRKTEIILQAVRTTLNKDEDIERIAKSIWPSIGVSIRDMVEGRVESDIEKLINKGRDSSSRRPCKQAFVRLIFDHLGNATACCPDTKKELDFGNIKTKDMLEIFNCDTAKRLRYDLKNGEAFKHNPCRNCSSFESFKNYISVWES